MNAAATVLGAAPVDIDFLSPAVALTLAAVAALCWPQALRQPAGLSATPRSVVIPHAATATAVRTRMLAPVVAGASAGLVIGVAAGLAAAALAATVATLIRRGRAEKAGTACREDLAATVRSFGAELRAGAEVATAAESAARTAGESGRRVLAGVAGAAGLGRTTLLTGVGTSALRSPVSVVEEEALRRMQAAWTLSHRHGMPLAELVDQLSDALAAQVRAAGRLRSDLAGPRLSGYLLGGLPLLGLVLGGTMGADPIRVLLTPGPGQLLLLAGVLLTCAGLLWSGRISR